jgi:hypothetical protein
MRLQTIASMATATAVLFSAVILSAHHSFSAAFEGSKAIQFKAVVRSVQISNPHSFVFVEVKGANGKTELLALEGPSLYGFNRKALKQDFLKKGDAIGVCGYAARPGVTTMVEYKNGEPGKMFSAEQLTLPNGRKLAWADYGTRKCLSQK